MKQFLVPILLFSLTLATSCTEQCDEPDVQAINALYFELQQGGEDGFSPVELDQIFYVRFIPFSEPLIADTFYPGGFFPLGEGRFYINDAYPFLNDQSPYFTVYGYQVVDLLSGYVANIENIGLEGQYDGECDYFNLKKEFTFNLDTVDRGGSVDFYPISK